MENISLAKDIGDIVTQNAINLSGNLAKSYLAKEIGDIVTQNEINYINLNFIRFYLVNKFSSKVSDCKIPILFPRQFRD